MRARVRSLGFDLGRRLFGSGLLLGLAARFGAVRGLAFDAEDFAKPGGLAVGPHAVALVLELEKLFVLGLQRQAFVAKDGRPLLLRAHRLGRRRHEPKLVRRKVLAVCRLEHDDVGQDRVRHHNLRCVVAARARTRSHMVSLWPA